MLIRKLFVLLFVFGMVTGYMLFGSARSVSAVSSGCATLNGGTGFQTISSGGEVTISFSYTGAPNLNLDAGDTIKWFISADVGQGGGMMEGQLYPSSDTGNTPLFRESITTAGTLSSSGSYVALTTEEYYLEISVVAPVVQSFTGLVSCIPAPPPPSPPPSPPSEVVFPPDDRINWQHGDLGVVLYEHESGDGVVAYCYNGNTWFGMYINQATVDGADASQPQDVPVAEVNENGCRAAFYMLDSGEYQINIWTFEGKLYEIISDSLNFADPTMRYFDPNE